MNKLILTFFLAVGIPFASMAEDKNDPKYLVGAVEMVEGKIVFSQEFDVPAMSKDDVYAEMLDWANSQFTPQGEFNSRIVYQDKEDGKIAAVGEQFLVFTSTALSLDRTEVSYQCIISCQDEKCKMDIMRIRYEYGSGDDMQKYLAEEWITDKMALNKAKTKLAPICGKFRRKTIDMKDELFASAATYLDKQLVKAVKSNASKPVEQIATTEDSKKEVSYEELPSILSKYLSDGRMTIIAGNNEEVEITAENWGGLGNLFSKNVAYILMDNSRFAATALLQHSDSFKIAFYAKGMNEPKVELECKKSSSQEMSTSDVASLTKADVASDKTYTMYIGEIVKWTVR